MKIYRRKFSNSRHKPYRNAELWLHLFFVGIIFAWLIGRSELGDEVLLIRWLNFLTPWLGIGTAIALLLALLKTRWAFVFLYSLLSLGLVPQAWTLNAPVLADTQPTSPKSLKVLSFNVGRFNLTYENLAPIILKSDADIILLQEVTRAERLKTRINESVRGKRYFVHNNKTNGLVLLSRYPILDARRLKGVLSRYHVAHPAGTITLWNAHIPRSIWSTEGQQRTMAGLVEDIAKIRGPKIIAGDFNATPYNDIMKIAAHSLRNSTTLQNAPFSYPTPEVYAGALGPWVQIDHILASDHFVSGNGGKISEHGGSDHFPVWRQLTLRGKAYTGRGTNSGEGAGEG